MAAELKPGDVFLTRGHSPVSRAIRFFTRSFGEKRTRVNHVGLVVTKGSLKSAVVVEAIRFVTRRTLWSGYGPPKKDSVAVFRATNLSQDEIQLIVARAESHVGKKYGWQMIVAHILDWILLGAYAFRRLVPGGNYPICSWVVADAFSTAGKHFGVAPGAASPDDIWDFVAERKPGRYKMVRPLTPLPREEAPKQHP